MVLKTLDVTKSERVLIGRALEASGANRTAAAPLLGMSVRTFETSRTGRVGRGMGREATGPRAGLVCFSSLLFVCLSPLSVCLSSLAEPPTHVQCGWAVVLVGGA